MEGLWQFMVVFLSPLSNLKNTHFRKINSLPVGDNRYSNLSSQKRPTGRNLGGNRLVRRSGTTSRGTVVLLFMGAWMAQWWERSPPTNVSRVRFPDPAWYVGWVCCWFSFLLREVFLRVLRFSPLLKNQHFQIPIRSGIVKHFIMGPSLGWLRKHPLSLTLNLHLHFFLRGMHSHSFSALNQNSLLFSF